MPTLMPTRHCFDDALDLISTRVMTDRADLFRLTLVHAICLAPDGSGIRYAHAWVEEAMPDGEVVCWDSAILDEQLVYYAQPLLEYYPRRLVQEATKYTVLEALSENYRSNHFGPWKSEYVALCTQHGEAQQVWAVDGELHERRDVSETDGAGDR